jgi:HEAT repeat protein
MRLMPKSVLMRALLLALVILVASGIFVLPAARCEEQPATIAQLIEQLGHERFELREQAIADLAHRGEPAREPLQRAISADNPEIRWRAVIAIRRIDARLALAEWEGEWKNEAGDWFKIVEDEWSSGTPKLGP